MTLDFIVQPQRFAVARLDPAAPIPAWATTKPFFSVTRTDEELSIICEETNVPDDCKATRGWHALALKGPFPFEAIGVAAEFTAVLAASRVSVLVVSTFDTDWVLVPGGQLEAAVRALRAAGHRVVP